jgi:hypothetical protein
LGQQIVKRIRLLALVLTILCFSVIGGLAQSQGIRKQELSQAKIGGIIERMTKNEDGLRRVWENVVVFKRNATIQTLGLGGLITGTYRRDSLMTFSESGERLEKILFNPVSTLKDIRITPEDVDNLGGKSTFSLTPSQVSLYNFKFLGKERVDEVDTYVFDVGPKVMPDPTKSQRRLFLGRIWVEDRDLMIARSKGKSVPDTSTNKFPVVETWRQHFDGKYWFPAYVTSNDEIVYDTGQVVKLRIRVKYSDFRAKD